MMNFIRFSKLLDLFVDKLHVGVATDMCLVVAKDIVNFPVSAIRLAGTIDVYWIVQDGGLCILIAYLLIQSKVQLSQINLPFHVDLSLNKTKF